MTRSSGEAFSARRAGSVKSKACWNAISIEQHNGVSPTQIHSLVVAIVRDIPQNYIDALMENNERIGNISRSKSPELTIYRQHIDALLNEMVAKASQDGTLNKDNIIAKIPKRALMWDIFLEALDGITPYINRDAVGLSIINTGKNSPDVLYAIRNRALSIGLMAWREPMIGLATVLQQVAKKKEQVAELFAAE